MHALNDPASPGSTVKSAASVLATGHYVPASSPPVAVQQQPGGNSNWLLRQAAFLGWIGLAVGVLFAFGQLAAFSDYFNTTGGISERFHSGAKFGSDKIAIIDISGVIVDGEGFVRNQIDRVREDESVKAIVVRVNSPGGTVTGSDYIFHHLTRLREERGIPLVVSMGSVAASGGYYVAMAVGDQERSIYAEPTTTTGSIGVIIPHYDVSGLLERLDVKDDSIASHPRKQMLTMTRPIPDDHRKLLEDYIQESFTRFKEIVYRGRPRFRADPAALDHLATGEIFSAPRAKEHGLIDEIGFLEEALDRARELAQLNKEQTRVVRFQRPASLFSLSGIALGTSSRSEWQTLLELSTPRAYYLATSLPPLLASYTLLNASR